MIQENPSQPPGKGQGVEEEQGFGPMKCGAGELGGCVLAVDPGAGFPARVSPSGEIREKNIALEGLR